MNKPNRIRILVADDHTIVRMGLVSLLSSQKDLVVVGEAEDGLEAVERTKAVQPDVVIMDIVMPKLDGAAATRRILASHPETKILVLTSFGTSEKVASALSSGARGALLKSATNDELLAAIRAVAAGQRINSDDACSGATQQGTPPSPLTPRQTEILDLISRGLTNKEIATVFGISPESVKSHVSEILSRIGAANRSEAVLIAARRQLIPGL